MNISVIAIILYVIIRFTCRRAVIYFRNNNIKIVTKIDKQMVVPYPNRDQICNVPR